MDGGQDHGVVGTDAGALVHGMRVAAIQQDVFFGADHEEGRREREHVEPLEIDVASIHDVECADLGKDLIEDINVVSLAIRDANEGRDIAVQTDQGVHFYGGFVLSELRPRKQRQAQIYGCGIQRIQALVEIHTDRIDGAEGSRNADQDVREVGKDAPGTRLIGVSQRGSRHLGLETHVVQLRAQRTEACFYIAQALPVGQLSEGHGQILVPAREGSQAGIAFVTSDTATKLTIGEDGDQLREHRAALVHEPLWATSKLAPESLSPFKSRQARNRRKPLQLKSLSTIAKYFTGH